MAVHQAVNSDGVNWVPRGAGNLAASDTYYKWSGGKGLEARVNRYVILYLATFFTAEVGDMLGEIRLSPAILFYLLYVVGILIFVSGPAAATSSSTLLYGALFGLFCYATFDLTSLALLKHWSWRVAVVDIPWGSFVTALSSTSGLLVANWLAPKV